MFELHINMLNVKIVTYIVNYAGESIFIHFPLSVSTRGFIFLGDVCRVWNTEKYNGDLWGNIRHGRGAA